MPKEIEEDWKNKRLFAKIFFQKRLTKGRENDIVSMYSDSTEDGLTAFVSHWTV